MQALDIIQTLSGQKSENDAAEAAALIGEHFRHKYIYPIKHNFDEKRDICRDNPSPRVNLMMAFLPFAKNKKMLENWIEVMTGYDAAYSMIKEISQKRSKKCEKNLKNETFENSKNEIFYEDFSDSEQKNILLAALLTVILNRM